LESPPLGENVWISPQREKEAAIIFQKLLVKHRVVVKGSTI